MKWLLFLVFLFSSFASAECSCDGVLSISSTSEGRVFSSSTSNTELILSDTYWGCNSPVSYASYRKVGQDTEKENFSLFQYVVSYYECVTECTLPQVEENGICVEPDTDPDTDDDNGTEPTDPDTDPDDNGTEPTDPEPDPDDNGTEPTDPDTDPDDNGTEPTDPEPDPDDNGTEPTDPDTDPDGDGGGGCPDPASTKDGFPFVGTSSSLSACNTSIADFGGGNGAVDVLEADGKKCIYCYYTKQEDGCEEGFHYKNPPDDFTCIPDDEESECPTPPNTHDGFKYQGIVSTKSTCNQAIQEFGGGAGTTIDIDYNGIECPIYCYYNDEEDPEEEEPDNPCGDHGTQTDFGCECDDGYEPGLTQPCIPKFDNEDDNDTENEDEEEDDENDSGGEDNNKTENEDEEEDELKDDNKTDLEEEDMLLINPDLIESLGEDIKDASASMEEATRLMENVISEFATFRENISAQVATVQSRYEVVTTMFKDKPEVKIPQGGSCNLTFDCCGKMIDLFQYLCVPLQKVSPIIIFIFSLLSQFTLIMIAIFLYKRS